jgi:hypothetical protein
MDIAPGECGATTSMASARCSVSPAWGSSLFRPCRYGSAPAQGFSGVCLALSNWATFSYRYGHCLSAYFPAPAIVALPVYALPVFLGVAPSSP